MTTDRITKASELHRRLTTLQNFNFGKDERDAGLYVQLKVSLGLPEGEFLRALEQAQTSAAAYLTALLAAAEPFSLMYRRILDYCKFTATRRTESSAQVKWDIEVDGQLVLFSDADLRVYEEVRSFAQPDLVLCPK